MGQGFRRVAIVNRGEAAMRFINAVREFNHENGAELSTIALYTEPDRKAMFVREADESYGLGPAMVVDPRDGGRRSAYLDYGRLRGALLETRAEAVWAGWGFVAEHASFAELLEGLGIVFIGPPSAAMRKLSDKIASKLLAESAGVPVVPWSGGPVTGLDGALGAGERLGYPLMIKASAGGGGRGIRRVAAPADLAAALAVARAEAEKAFGDGTLFLEKAIQGARHVEVQILADDHGTTWAVGVRDCTVQRRHQKVVEESPAPTLTAAQDAALREGAVRIGQVAGYRSAGTVEFLFDSEAGRSLFIEVNTRLQVEHTVTEVTTGLDLVKLQLHVARGGRLLGEPPPPSGHAIEVRLNAEDPDDGFAPAPGTCALFRLPTGPGLRIDRGVTEGDIIAPEFDSMVAKVIAHGRTRQEALSRLHRALSESAIVVRGGTTNRAFLLEILDRPEFRRAEVDTGWLERLMAEPAPLRPHAALALVQAAVEVYEAEHALEQAAFYATAARLRPEVSPDVGRMVEFRHAGRSYRAKVRKRGGRDYRVELDGRSLDAQVEPLGRFERWLTAAGRRHRVVSLVQGAHHVVEVEGVPHRFSRDDLGLLRSTSPAVVVKIAVAPGDAVNPGDPLLVLEAMKMETTVVAPFRGRVRRVLVMDNVQVPPGGPLVELEPEAEAEAAKGERLALPEAEGDEGDVSAAEEVRRNLEDVRRLVLGFDVEASEARQLAETYGRLAREDGPSGERSRREDEILGIFADVASLFRRRRAPEEGEEAEALSSGEYFLTYLRNVDAADPGLPPAFVDRIRQAVAHYGVPDLCPSPELRDALFWIWKARQRADEQIPVLIAILDRRLAGAVARAEEPDEAFVPTLDRLIAAAEGRHPSLADVAREARYRIFEQPLYERARRRAYAEAERDLGKLRQDPHGPEREALVASLVACPQPLFGFLAGRFEEETHDMRRLMIELMTRRYYRIRRLENVRTWDRKGWVGAAADYDHEGRRIRLVSSHLVATHVLDARFPEAARRLRGLVGGIPLDLDVVLDFYVWSPGCLEEPNASASRVKEMLDAVGFTRPIRRVVVALSGPEAGNGRRGAQHFTFRSSPEGFREEKLYRGFHPMMGKRLRLFRLANFDIERLPSAEDVYLFKGIARENPRDERLFALAEVRDATPVRDASGRIVQIPHLERIFVEAATAMRAFQARRRPQERLNWNRIFLDVRPPLDVTLEELRAIACRYGPATAGLGLEKVLMRASFRDPATGGYKDMLLGLSNPGTAAFVIAVEPSTPEPIRPLSEYGQKVTRMRQRGLTYPYEIVRLLTPSGDAAHSEIPPGEFEEWDLGGESRLAPSPRPYGRNEANVVVGVIRNFTDRYPEGMTRVILLGDPSREMGSIAEPECRRILAALDLAASWGVPLEWFTLSAGAKIAMGSGTENMDWISRVLRRLVVFTQAGGEVNVVVCGINVGAQPYWNAEATMLMHTKGILVMVPESAMVLTGKTALDYSGSVSAEDNFGIGGYERIMGPNGEAQYWARDVAEASRILLRHYDHAYVAKGERFPRRARTVDPLTRDVRAAPHGGGDGEGFSLVGHVFADETNPGRKKPFDIRRVMAAVADQDHPPLERWSAMRDAEIAVVWDAHLGGIPVALLGIESKPVPRLGFVPTDGPERWMSGTLFPKSSKKVAHAINAASGNRPLVILANLSGFDGSPESMRRMQLEYGAEIGRAVVNFQGPIVFCVISRYHGGAFVVFSRALHDNLQALALEGSHASVIGGAPAAAVVFAREVDARTGRDSRVQEVEAELAAAEDSDKRRLRARLEEVRKVVRSEKLGEVADEFDRIHSVDRALEVGSLDRIIPASRLRPCLVEAVERGMARELERIGHGTGVLAQPASR